MIGSFFGGVEAVGRDHPSYDNPTLAEAICEIQFTPRETSWWSNKGASDFFKEISEHYPRFESLPMPQQVVQIAFGGASNAVMPTFPVESEQALTKFISADGSFTCALGPRVLRVHKAAPYPGWEAYEAEILWLWSRLVVLADPKTVTRIGLRYLNLVPLKDSSGAYVDYFLPTRSIPESVVNSKVEFPLALRVEAWKDAHNVLILSLNKVSALSDGRIAMLLDLDRALLNIEGSVVSAEDLTSTINKLHDDVWEEFDAACGPKLRAHLKAKT